MKITVRDRIKLFLQHLDIGQNSFEAKVKWSNGYINNTKSISADKLNQVINEYPQLNLNWLITGKGEMIIPSIHPDSAEQTIEAGKEGIVDYKDKYLEILEENRSLRIEIELLRKSKEPKSDK